MPPGRIQTQDLSRRAAADLRLRPRGNWDRLDRHPTLIKIILHSHVSLLILFYFYISKVITLPQGFRIIFSMYLYPTHECYMLRPSQLSGCDHALIISVLTEKKLYRL